jgi:type IV pilus assembly protein PilX
MKPQHHPASHRQRGAVLFVSLILLLILTLIGITAARIQTSEEAMARNENNHQLAIQAAEAALRSGESLVNLYATADFSVDSNGLFELTAETQGALAGSITDSPNVWTTPGNTITYAGPALSDAPASYKPAQIIIESLPPAASSMICTPQYGANGDCSVYRVTAHATGADGSANATLQSIYRNPKP